MADAVVLTAVYGGYDRPWGQAEQDIAVDWLCFTDEPSLPAPAPWQVIYDPPAYAHPNMAAKFHKCQPQLSDSDVIWIDANMEVVSRSFAREALAARHDGVAVWRHPRRDCIYEEAKASIGSEAQGGKYDGLPITEQVEHYRSLGHPEHGGLFACGTIAWDRTSRRALELGATWLEECELWTFQDQLSLPFVARRMGVEPGLFPVRQIERRRPQWLENRWLRLHPHGDHL